MYEQFVIFDRVSVLFYVCSRLPFTHQFDRKEIRHAHTHPSDQHRLDRIPFLAYTGSAVTPFDIPSSIQKNLLPPPMIEKSLVLLKPDAIKRRLIGTIISRYEQKGLYIHRLKLLQPSYELVAEHYAEHKSKSFYKKMVEYLSSNMVVAMVVAGEDAVAAVRKLNGVTDPLNAELGSIRGDYGMCVGRNVVHGSESVEAGECEVRLWFGEDDGEVDVFDAQNIYEED